MQAKPSITHIPPAFKSSDLSLVSAILTTQRAKLIRTQRVSPYKFLFDLHPLEICLELEREYINNNLMVSAKAISENIKLLKGLMKNYENQ